MCSQPTGTECESRVRWGGAPSLRLLSYDHVDVLRCEWCDWRGDARYLRVASLESCSAFVGSCLRLYSIQLCGVAVRLYAFILNQLEWSRPDSVWYMYTIVISI